MPWAKLSDDLWTNPKLRKAGPEAAWLYCCLLSYCANYSDGEVEDDAQVLQGVSPTLLKKLSSLGLLRRRKSSWFVPGYAAINRTKAQWEEYRQNKAQRQRRWREKRAAESADDVDGLQDDLRDGLVRTGLRTGQEQGSKGEGGEPRRSGQESKRDGLMARVTDVPGPDGPVAP